MCSSVRVCVCLSLCSYTINLPNLNKELTEDSEAHFNQILSVKVVCV